MACIYKPRSIQRMEGKKNMKESKEKDYKKRFLNGLSLLCKSRNMYEVWSDTMYLFACGIANPTISPLKENIVFRDVWEEREREYLRIINKYNKKEQRLFPQMFALLVKELDIHPWQDLLGEIYMMAGISNKNVGQFFTPYSVCQMMTEVTMQKKAVAKTVHKQGYVSINDPACGAGATLVAVIEWCSKIFKKLNYQNHVYFVAQDIDRIVANMCYIQLSLHGVAGYVIIGDTLTEPVVTDLHRVWFTPVWFSDVWTLRRLFHGQDILGGEIKQDVKNSHWN